MNSVGYSNQVLCILRQGLWGLLIICAVGSLDVPADTVIDTHDDLSVQFKKAQAELNDKEYQAAHTILLPLGQAGHAQAQDVLASMYLQGLGVKANREQAMRWYCALAHQPQGGRIVSRALWLLAEYFRTGGGIPDKRYKNKRRENEDPYRAYFWFEILARQKDYYQQVFPDGQKLGNLGRYVVARQLMEAEIDRVKQYLGQWEPRKSLVSLEKCLALPQG